MVAVATGSKRNLQVLGQIADDVVEWTKSDGMERDESDVLKDIMDNFNFHPCGKIIAFLMRKFTITS